MNKARLLSTAAALLLSVGVASAQEPTKRNEAPGRAPAAQQNAPAEKIAPAQKGAPALRSEGKAHETTGQAPSKEPEAAGQTPRKEENTHMGKDSQMNKSGEGKDGRMDKSGEPHAQSDVKSKSNESAAQQHNSTTGQGAAATAGKLSTEQRTKISAVFRQHKVTPAHLNVSINVGTRVPDSVHFYPLPQEVVVIYPEWRGYDYIMVGDQIIVVDPRSHEIVAILEA